MSEIVEYTLVVMASALLVSGSVAVYDSFSNLESELQLREAFATISDLASQAVNTGAASTTMSIPASTISCEDSSLTLSFGSLGISHSVPLDCDFIQRVAGGERSLAFAVSGNSLLLTVN